EAFAEAASPVAPTSGLPVEARLTLAHEQTASDLQRGITHPPSPADNSEREGLAPTVHGSEMRLIKRAAVPNSPAEGPTGESLRRASSSGQPSSDDAGLQPRSVPDFPLLLAGHGGQTSVASASARETAEATQDRMERVVKMPARRLESESGLIDEPGLV